jgi:2-dehydro-3-deoxyphosphooctonate aldolase (KDO 8-P synthase)
MQIVTIGNVQCGGDSPLLLIAGPCQIEGLDHALSCAEALAKMAADAGMGFVYKSSYDKANRTSAGAKRGVGMDEGLDVLAKVKAQIGVPVLSDVHLPDHCAAAAEVSDIIQIPAFLCRQTDLLVAAAKTGRVINIKKGQFLAPWDMKHVAEKVTNAGNQKLLLTERGTTFGYNTLVSDMRSLPTMAAFGHPVFLMQHTRCSNLAVLVAVLVANVNLYRFWRGQRLLLACRVCLWNHMKTLIRHRLTGRIWCHYPKCHPCLPN